MVSEWFQSGLKPVSEWFQSGLKPCGFRGVLEGSETMKISLDDFGRRLLKIYCDVSPMIIGETSQ